MSNGPVEFSVDFSGLSAGLQALSTKADEAKGKAALRVAYEIIRLSSFEMPHDKGTLQNSATVQVIDGAIVLGYHGPYAARLHEHPEYAFQKGRKGKYLSDPIVKNAAVLGVEMGEGFEEALES